jgi:hypothetical protein
MGESNVFQKIEVHENDGTRSVLNITHYESLNDGYTYFYTSYGTKRALTNRITGIYSKGIKYSIVSEIAGKGAALVTVACIKKPLTNAIMNACPSQNPIIKGCWKGAAKVTTWAIAGVADRTVTHAVQEVTQPFVDGMRMGLDISKKIIENVKNTVKEEPQMKEVFEENTNI